MSSQATPSPRPGDGTSDRASTRAHAITTHTAALRKALVQGTIGLIVLLLLAGLVWTLIDGTAGAWGALIGSGIAGIFLLTTAITALGTAHSPPTVTGAVMLGTWLLKIVVVIAAVAVLRDQDFYSRPAFISSLVIAMIVVLFIETRAIVRAKVPYVEPEGES